MKYVANTTFYDKRTSVMETNMENMVHTKEYCIHVEVANYMMKVPVRQGNKTTWRKKSAINFNCFQCCTS